VHADDVDKCLETYVKAFDNREPFYMEYRLLNKHGEYRWIGDHGRPFYDLDNTFLGYIGSCYDITQNKLNEQKLVKLNATKDKFFSIVAHDLRNPISTFVSLSQFLIDEHDAFDPGEMTEIAIQMHKDSKNTLLLLENLLDWSRAQTDEISFKPKPIKLTDLFQEVADQVDLCAKAKKIRLEKMKELPDLTITVDPNMLKTVLRNLLMNSIKFTNAEGTIRVEARRLEKDEVVDGEKDHPLLEAGSLLVSVSDNGVGMSEHLVATLFDLVGATVSRPGTDDEGGSGLGLIICKDFIEKHDGTIWAESEPGKGTTFKFTIPLASVTDRP